MNRDDLRAALQDSNLRALLHVIHEGEQGDRSADVAYRTRFGGDTFDSYADHPRTLVRKQGIASTAAGRWQFLERTWDGLVRQYGFADFTPESQDEAAVALIAERGALDDIRAGRFETAVRKIAQVWASLPESPYGQPTISWQRARAVYEAYGGRYAPGEGNPMPAQSAAPVADSRAAAPIVESKPMAPILAAILPSLVSAVPELVKSFGSGSEVAQRNSRAAEIIVDAATKATNSVNAQQAVEKIEADPAARTAFQNEIRNRWFELGEAGGGGIAGARKADAEFMQRDGRVWKSPAFIVTSLLLPLVYMVVSAVVFQMGGEWSSEIRASVVSAVVSGVLFAIVGYWLGSSLGSAVKDQAMRR